MIPTNSHVKCDEPDCDWIIDIEFEKIKEWHNKPCPRCSKGIIVNDTDLIVYNIVLAGMHIADIVDPDRKHRSKESTKLDTGKMR